MAALTPDELRRGVVACSAGNHAQGVAISARKLNTTSTVVMPTVTPSIKVDAVRAFGATVKLCGQNYDEPLGE